MASSGNFATWNRLVYSTNFRSGMSPSYGNTRSNPGNACIGFSTMAMTTGKKWYIEAYAILAYNLGTIGIFSLDSYATKNNFNANYHNSDGIFWHSNGQLYIESDISQSTTAYNSGDVVAFAVDLESTTETVKFYKNGSLQDTQNIPSGFLNRDWFFSLSRPTSGGGYIMNAGQDSTFAGTISAGGNSDDNGFGDFKYSVPSGYLALCSGNLGISDDIDPAQTDDNYPQKQFNTVLYTGNATNGHGITGLGLQPDMVWFQRRSVSGAYGEGIIDSNRGASVGLYPNRTEQEANFSSDFVSFDSDGFTLNAGSSANINNSGQTFVAWCWRANGGTTASNSSGSITSTVQANQAAGFSIVTYAGNDGSWGSGNRDTFGHGLSAAPEFIIIKERNNTDAWTVFHAHVGNGGGSNAAANNLRLDTSDALYTNQSYKSFGETMPTSTLVTVEGNTTNSSGVNHVAYCWHSVEGYSKFGSYEGNDNTDGPFVYTGFRPRMLCIKGVDEAYSWFVFDSARNTFNLVDKHLRWDGTDAELTEPTGARRVDFLSNGFKVRASAASLNGNNDTYVYMAWGDVPFKYNNSF